MNEWKIGDRINDLNPGRDANGKEFEITAITDDPKDDQGKEVQKNIGRSATLIYFRTVKGTGGGIVPLEYANQNFKKVSRGGIW